MSRIHERCQVFVDSFGFIPSSCTIQNPPYFYLFRTRYRSSQKSCITSFTSLYPTPHVSHVLSVNRVRSQSFPKDLHDYGFESEFRIRRTLLSLTFPLEPSFILCWFQYPLHSFFLDVLQVPYLSPFSTLVSSSVFSPVSFIAVSVVSLY